MISKFTEAITSRFPRLSVKDQSEAHHLTDRLEDIDELFLPHIVGDISHENDLAHLKAM